MPTELIAVEFVPMSSLLVLTAVETVARLAPTVEMAVELMTTLLSTVDTWTPTLSTFKGSALAAARKAAHLSQEQVRTTIGASSRQRVSDLEHGHKRPTLTELYALAGALRFKLEGFFPIVTPEAPAEPSKADDWSEVGGVKAIEPSEDAKEAVA